MSKGFVLSDKMCSFLDRVCDDEFSVDYDKMLFISYVFINHMIWKFPNKSVNQGSLSNVLINNNFSEKNISVFYSIHTKKWWKNGKLDIEMDEDKQNGCY